jgi:acyl-CoA synthetase (NDP forming)
VSTSVSDSRVVNAGLPSLERMLRPKSLAVVGASESNPFLGRLLDNADAANLDLILVHPRAEVFGRPTIGSLLDIGRPVDAIFSLVGADNAVRVVEEAAQIGAGGVILTAAGFGEAGAAGVAREQRVRDIARDTGLAICGANCLGVYNVVDSIHMYIGAERSVRPGHVALISQSGGLYTTLQLAAQERQIGFSQLISTGNETATDLVDFLEFLIDDPHTSAVAMIIEQIRRPQEFLAAARRAADAGMFLTAVKLGRSPGGQRAAVSHTGALMTDASDYDIALRQAGVAVANGLDELLGLVQMFSHLPPRKWSPANKVAVLTASGGAAALVADTFDDLGIPLVQDDELTAHAAAKIPGTLSANPLDITGVFYNEKAFEELLQLFIDSPTYDTIMVVSYLQEGMQAFSRPLLEPLRKVAASTDKRLVAVSVAETAIAPWAAELLDSGVALGSGIRATANSLAAMTRLVERAAPVEYQAIESRQRPHPTETYVFDGTEMLTFEAGMALLADFGIPVAPHDAWQSDSNQAEKAGRFVVKLADIPHRTEVGAVRVGQQWGQIEETVGLLQKIASDIGATPTVVVQPMVEIEHEIFIGVQGKSAFGPVVIVGIGGVTVEVLRDISSRIAPFDIHEAHQMLSELRATKLLDAFRGRPGVDRERLAELLVKVGNLAVASAPWLESLDINPLISNRDGFVAVDVSVVLE